MFVPDKLDPVTVPVAATELGVIAPSVKVIAGVVVGVATTPDTPFAVVTETDVTVAFVGVSHEGEAADPPDVKT